MAALAAIGYLAVAALTPVAVNPHLAHDDGLYMQLGRHLALGEWLGGYNQMTLARGIGYPLFLAAVAWSGLSIALAHALLKLVAAAAVGFCAVRVSGRRLLGWVLFSVALWNPVSLTEGLLRTTRDAIHGEVVLLLLATTILALWGSRSRWGATWWGAAAGLALGWAFVLREEGIWLVPGMVVAAVLAVVGESWQRRVRRPVVVAGLVAMIAAVAAFSGTIHLVNRLWYGSWVGIEIRESSFEAALSALQRIEISTVVPRVPVPKEAREIAYAVSPAFSSLRPALDGPGGPGFQEGCKVSPASCGDLAAGWFHWALRDAAAASGHYQTPTTAKAFYRTVAREIGAACASGRIRCRRHLSPHLPRRGPVAWREVSTRLLQVAEALTLAGPIHVELRPVGATRRQLETALPLLNQPLHRPSREQQGSWEVRGWYYLSGSGWFDARVSSLKEPSRPLRVGRRSSPDLVAVFADARASSQRFDEEVVCPRGCRLELTDFEGFEARAGLAQLEGTGRSLRLGRGTIFFDRVAWLSPTAFDRRVRAVMRLRAGLLRLAQVVLPALELVGLVALVAVAWRLFRRRSCGPLEGAALAAWMLLSSRVGFLILIDLAATPVLGLLYLSPAVALAPVASLLSIAAFWLGGGAHVGGGRSAG